MKTRTKKYAVKFNEMYYCMKEGKFVKELNKATLATKGFWTWIKKKDQWHSARMLNSTIEKIKI